MGHPVGRRGTKRLSSLGLLLLGLGCGCGGKVQEGDPAPLPMAQGGVPYRDVQGDALSSATNASGGVSSRSGVATTAAPPSGAGGAASAYVPLDDFEAIYWRERSCVGWTAECEQIPAAFQFVVDLGSGMARRNVEGQTHWDHTRQMLLDALARLPAQIEVGLGFFPNLDTVQHSGEPLPSSACIDASQDVPLAPLGEAGSQQREQLEQALSTVRARPETGTPIRDALAVGHTHLAATDPAGRSNAPMLVLVTDGEPTLDLGCTGEGTPGTDVGTDAVIEDIRIALEDLGVPTLVVGSPGAQSTASGVDARQWLSQAASAGWPNQCPWRSAGFQHVDLSSAEPGEDQLLDQYDALSSCYWPTCSMSLPSPPPGDSVVERYHVIVTLNSEFYALQEQPSSNCEHGWYLGDDSIELCRASCELVKCAREGKLELLAECGSG